MKHKKEPNKPNVKLPVTKNGNPCNEIRSVRKD